MRPCTTSKPLFLPRKAAAKCRSLRDLRSRWGALKATSLTSKIFIGTLWCLFSRSVFSRPGSRDVRTTWYSAVFGLASLTAVVPSSMRFRWEKFSACEQRIRGSTSDQPAIAASSRTMSLSLLMARGWATVPEISGKARGRRLKP